MTEAGRFDRIETVAVHAGDIAEVGSAVPTSVPIHNAASFSYDSAAALDRAFESGHVYSRFSNPTVAAFEAAVAALEAADAAVAFGSGMAALHGALVSLIGGPDDLILASRDCYGGTHGLLTGPLQQLGVRCEFADLTDRRGLDRALTLSPRVILLETISNPLLRVVDIEMVVERARRAGARVVVDNTFGTPCLCRPLALGADLVVHSATKYLGGHGDVTAGVVACKDGLEAKVRQIARLVGGVLGPNEAWLALRGLRTLALRIQRQCENAFEIAQWLERQDLVERVYYPGLRSHPQHRLARRLLKGGFGAVVSFDLRAGDVEKVGRFVDGLRLFRNAPTVGDVTSLVMYPRRAAQRGLTTDECLGLGIGPGLIRLSVGIEAVEDLKSDLAAGLEATSV